MEQSNIPTIAALFFFAVVFWITILGNRQLAKEKKELLLSISKKYKGVIRNYFWINPHLYIPFRGKEVKVFISDPEGAFASKVIFFELPVQLSCNPWGMIQPKGLLVKFFGGVQINKSFGLDPQLALSYEIYFRDDKYIKNFLSPNAQKVLMELLQYRPSISIYQRKVNVLVPIKSMDVVSLQRLLELVLNYFQAVVVS